MEGNGQQSREMSPAQLVQLQELVANVYQFRTDLLRRFFDRKDSVDKECGYPQSFDASHYRDMYERMAIAERVVQLMPRECWQVSPLVYEDEDSAKVTKFEEAWDGLGKRLKGSSRFNGKGKSRKGVTQNKDDKRPNSWHQDEKGSLVWSYLLRADVLSGIGVFGVILLGINDGRQLYQPADGAPNDGSPKDVTGVSKDVYGGALPIQPLSSVMGTDAQYTGTQFSPAISLDDKGEPEKDEDGNTELLFIRVFDESLVQIVQYEADVRNPRFGQPVMYRITLNDPRQPHTGVGLPLATLMVHWSRCVHLADNLLSSEIFGVPRLRPVMNNILDLRKLYGGSAEMYWRGAFMGISLETHPQLGGDVVIDKEKTRKMMDGYFAGLDRDILLSGMTAKTLAPQVVDPSPQIATQIEAICIQIGCPVRVFKGSERGELASSQDDSSWNDRLRHRQDVYLTPRVIVPFVDRLIMLGVLPEPEGYSVEWPDLESLSDKDKAAIMLQKTQAVQAYVGGNCETVLPIHDFLTRVMGFDDEEAEEIVDAAQKAQEDKQQDAQDMADQHGMIPEPPPGFQHPEPPPPPAAPVKVKPGEKLVQPPVPKPTTPPPPPQTGGKP